MTKRREPLSIDAALARIAGRVAGGWAGMGAMVEKAERTVRNWGDPDTPEQIPMDAAVTLDLAFMALGGDAPPIHEAYSALLEVAVAQRFARPLAIARELPEVIREVAEAESDLAIAAQPGAGAAQRATALRAIGQAIARLSGVRLLLKTDHEHLPP